MCVHEYKWMSTDYFVNHLQTVCQNSKLNFNDHILMYGKYCTVKGKKAFPSIHFQLLIQVWIMRAAVWAEIHRPPSPQLSLSSMLGGRRGQASQRDITSPVCPGFAQGSSPSGIWNTAWHVKLQAAFNQYTYSISSTLYLYIIQTLKTKASKEMKEGKYILCL